MDIKQENRGEQQTVINNESGTVNLHHGYQYTTLTEESVYKEITHAQQDSFKRKLFKGCCIVIPIVIGLYVNLGQIFSTHLNLPWWVYLIIIIALGLLVFPFLCQYHLNLALLGRRFNQEEGIHLHDDTFCRKHADGYTLFTKIGQCIYPDCAGSIMITKRPQRYNGNYAHYGVCSLTGEEHSYGIDSNPKAYREKIDWRRLEPEKLST